MSIKDSEKVMEYNIININTKSKNYNVIIKKLGNIKLDSKVLIVSTECVWGLYGEYVVSALNLWRENDFKSESSKMRKMQRLGDYNVLNSDSTSLSSKKSKFFIESALLHICLLPDGEIYKNMESIEKILNVAFECKLNRNSMMIALGGGVISDMVGFASGIYQRGIEFFTIPTTLLAMVDASVGGKCGINNAYGKNLIGLFHQPCAVYIDMHFLRTLPSREFGAGMAEIIKILSCFDYEMLNSVNFENLNSLYKEEGLESSNYSGQMHGLDSNFKLSKIKECEIMEQNLGHKNHNDSKCNNKKNENTKSNSYTAYTPHSAVSLKNLIYRSIELKARIVESDEEEKSGLRALLNYGHTFGHSIELECNFKTYLHGEAVSMGIVMANALSVKLGILSPQIANKIESKMRLCSLPTRYKIKNLERFYDSFFLDKKSLDSKLHFVLLESSKREDSTPHVFARIHNDIPKGVILEVLREFS